METFCERFGSLEQLFNVSDDILHNVADKIVSILQISLNFQRKFVHQNVANIVQKITISFQINSQNTQ